FLTPTILRDSKDMSRISVKKNNQRRKFNKENNVKESQGLYDYGFNETLNMAPIQTEEVKHEQPAREVPKRHFDYMNDSDDDAVEASSSSSDSLRGRYASPADSSGVFANAREQDEDVENIEVKTAPASADNTNPFANVRPN
ncbi:MAG: hypothetical protein R3A45_08630, partial [Bdellovibrionota bacterium]